MNISASQPHKLSLTVGDMVLLSMISIASIAATMITPVLPSLQAYFAVDKSAINHVIGLFLLGYLMGQVIHGPLSNRIGRVTTIQIGLLTHLFGTVICIAATHYQLYSLMLFGRWISALGSAAGLVCTITLINEQCTLQKATHLLSYAVWSFTLGIYLGTLLGATVATHCGWRWVFVLLLLHGVIMLASTRMLNRDSANPGQPRSLKGIVTAYLKALTNTKLVVFSCVLSMATVIAYVYAAQAPLIAQNPPLALSVQGYGAWNMLNAIGMLLGGGCSACLSQKYRGIQVIHLGLLLSAIAIVEIYLSSKLQCSNPWWFFGGTALLSLASGLIYPSATAYASNALPCKANASSAMSVINLGGGILVVTACGYLPFSDINTLVVALSGYLLFVSLLLLWYRSFNAV